MASPYIFSSKLKINVCEELDISNLRSSIETPSSAASGGNLVPEEPRFVLYLHTSPPQPQLRFVPQTGSSSGHQNYSTQMKLHWP